jgi:hypothetical protein
MSTPEERIAALEARMNGAEGWLQSIDTKLDTVIEAMNMGKGAWFLLLKVGAAIVAVAGAVAWLSDHIQAAWK